MFDCLDNMGLQTPARSIALALPRLSGEVNFKRRLHNALLQAALRHLTHSSVFGRETYELRTRKDTTLSAASIF
jgi:hypothetical protein